MRDYQMLATNPGGHSSLPRPDNAIYHVADALAALQKSPFPFELNSVTREYFEQMAKIEPAEYGRGHARHLAVDRPIRRRLPGCRRTRATTPPCARLASPPCSRGGHAFNALPQRAEANVNCRIFPGHSQEEIRLELVKMFDDPVAHRYATGPTAARCRITARIARPWCRRRCGPDDHGFAAQRLGKLWPGTPVVPIMETGASDSIYTMMAGIPSYGINGVAIDRDDLRMHGKDERVKVDIVLPGAEFYYEFFKALTTRKH